MSETKIPTARIDATVEFDFSEVATNDGTAALPAYSFTSAQNLGLFKPATDTLAISTAGVEQWRVGGGGNLQSQGAGVVRTSDGSVTAPGLSFAADTNTGMYRIGVDDLGFAVGGIKALEIDSNLRLTISSTGGSGLRVYGGSGTHQWDVYLNSTNLRFSDNTGGGSLVFDNLTQFSSGAAATPSIAFAATPTTGLYTLGDNSIRFAIAGTQRHIFDSNAIATPAGSVALPSHTFTGDTATGLFLNGAGDLRISVSGAQQGIFSSGGFFPNTKVAAQADGTAAAPFYTFSADSDTGIYRGAANALNFSSGGTGIAIVGPAGFQMSTGQVLALDGTVAAPGISFANQTGTGLFRTGANNMQLVISGFSYVTLAGTLVQTNVAVANIDGSTATPAYTFLSDGDTGMYRLGTNFLGFSAGGTGILGISTGGLFAVSDNSFSCGAIGNSWSTMAGHTTYVDTVNFFAHTTTGMYNPSSDDIGFRNTGTKNFVINAGGIYPGNDNTETNGNSSFRWTEVWTSALKNSGTAGVSILGTSTNSSAAAGDVGQIISSTANLSPTTSGNYGDLTSIALTAGDWLVSYNLVISDGAPNSYTRLIAAISTTSGNAISGVVLGDNYMVQDGEVNQAFGATIASYRISLSATTTYYAKYRAVYSGSVQQLHGRITAVRIR